MKRIKVAARPRNPVAPQARKRNAGAHGPANPARHARRLQRQALRQLAPHAMKGDSDA